MCVGQELVAPSKPARPNAARAVSPVCFAGVDHRALSHAGVRAVPLAHGGRCYRFFHDKPRTRNAARNPLTRRPGPSKIPGCPARGIIPGSGAGVRRVDQHRRVEVVFFHVDIDDVHTREQRPTEQVAVGPAPRRHIPRVCPGFRGELSRGKLTYATLWMRRLFPAPRARQRERQRSTGFAPPADRPAFGVKRCHPGTRLPEGRLRLPFVSTQFDRGCAEFVGKRGIETWSGSASHRLPTRLRLRSWSTHRRRSWFRSQCTTRRRSARSRSANRHSQNYHLPRDIRWPSLCTSPQCNQRGSERARHCCWAQSARRTCHVAGCRWRHQHSRTLEESALAAIRAKDAYLAFRRPLHPSTARRGHKKALGAVKHSMP